MKEVHGDEATRTPLVKEVHGDEAPTRFAKYMKDIAGIYYYVSGVIWIF